MTDRYFVQLAGAGLDARAVELVSWELKKKLGPLAYVAAGFSALRETPARITAAGPRDTLEGELVLLGNGRLYGGDYRVFPAADPADGLLDVCVFPRARLATVLRLGPGLVLRHRLPESCCRRFQATEVTLTSSRQTPLEVDGELIGHLPATFSLQPAALRVLAP